MEWGLLLGGCSHGKSMLGPTWSRGWPRCPLGTFRGREIASHRRGRVVLMGSLRLAVDSSCGVDWHGGSTSGSLERPESSPMHRYMYTCICICICIGAPREPRGLRTWRIAGRLQVG